MRQVNGAKSRTVAQSRLKRFSARERLQSHALALLLCGTSALSGYLFAIIAQPEKL